eukprot:scaffold2365_cov77-Skeletonema_dohrnii-CCMP3373.AAC.9
MSSGNDNYCTAAFKAGWGLGIAPPSLSLASEAARSHSMVIDKSRHHVSASQSHHFFLTSQHTAKSNEVTKQSH